MNLGDLLLETGEWLRGTGPNSEIVISSRVRLARNLEKLLFSTRAKEKDRAEVERLVRDAVGQSNFLKGALLAEMNKLSDADKLFLVERHLISREFASGDADSKTVVVSEKEIVSIMINEEDHLRMQTLQSGLNLLECWRVLERIDAELEEKMSIAFSPQWGYLTACPTNTGTGLRASVMLHLPALALKRQMGKVIQAINKLNLTVRGLYGEGTEASGNFFQISNQTSLGQAEVEIIDNIERVIKQVIGYEEESRRGLVNKDRSALEDQVWRAYGILRNSRIISSAETIGLLSAIRLGVECGIIENISRQAINELFILTQPGHLQKIEGRSLSAAERDRKRADLIREKLKQ